MRSAKFGIMIRLYSIRRMNWKIEATPRESDFFRDQIIAFSLNIV